MNLSDEEKRLIEREAYKEVCITFYRKQFADVERFSEVKPRVEPAFEDFEMVEKGLLPEKDYFMLTRRPNGKFSTVLHVSLETFDELKWDLDQKLYFDLTSEGNPCFMFEAVSGSMVQKGIQPECSTNGLRFTTVRPFSTPLHPEMSCFDARYFKASRMDHGFYIGTEFCIEE